MKSILTKRASLLLGIGTVSFICGYVITAAEESTRDSAGFAAAKFAVYGMVANNAFKESSRPHFTLPDNWKFIRQVDDQLSGLQFNLYEVLGDGTNNVVIAFRGSDSEVDHPATSKKQYEVVDKLLPGIIQDYPTAQIIAVGHSLGGGLALHTSLVFDGIDAFAFNPSPRVFRDGKNKPNTRYMINEKGDPLNKVRAVWKEVPGIQEWEFDFSEYSEKQHLSYPLALGLLLLGSSANSELLALMQKNCDVLLHDDCKMMREKIQKKYNLTIN